MVGTIIGGYDDQNFTKNLESWFEEDIVGLSGGSASSNSPQALSLDGQLVYAGYQYGLVQSMYQMVQLNGLLQKVDATHLLLGETECILWLSNYILLKWSTRKDLGV